MNNNFLLKLSGICKDYRQGRSTIEVLTDVNLEVFAGDMVAIVGASGSGKSTLLHIAGLLDKADKGTVQIAGVKDEETANLKYSPQIRLQNIGFIYQYHHLLPDFTARENAAMPLIIAGANIQDAYAKADEFLTRVGLGNRLYNVPGELSGGEMQRVAIARSLINNPKIILADEPTGNLDPHNAEEVFAIFLEQSKQLGAAIIMVTHNMDLAKKMDKTYKLDYRLVLQE